MRVALRTVAVALLPPFHHIAATAVFRNQLAQLIAALARAFAAFDAQHIELAFDVAENEIGSMARAYSITSSAVASSVAGNRSPVRREGGAAHQRPRYGCGPEWRSSRSARNTLL
jgi:hypothetical protein